MDKSKNRDCCSRKNGERAAGEGGLMNLFNQIERNLEWRGMGGQNSWKGVENMECIVFMFP